MTRVAGTAVFLNRNKVTAPLAMRASVDHLHALSEHVVILSIDTLTISHVPNAERIVIDDLGYRDDGITHATARFGYMDQPNVPAVLRQIATAADLEFAIDVGELSYFLSTIDLYRSDAPGLSRWRKTLFLATAQHHRRRRRLLRPSPRPHGDHGLAHRGLARMRDHSSLN